MRKSCTYGSVRGAPSDGRPYRNWRAAPLIYATAPLLIGCANQAGTPLTPSEEVQQRFYTPECAGEAGHGPKSDAHANCGNHEKYGKGRLRAPASWALIDSSGPMI
jgi:hypothetical protein